MDTLLKYQEQVMRAVCGRFGGDLAYLLVQDQLADEQGALLDFDILIELYRGRMIQLIAPAKEHGLLVALHSRGRIDHLLKVLYEIGIDAIHGLDPETNDITAIRQEWAGRLALISNIPTTLLERGTQNAVQNRVREFCHQLAPGGGFVLGSAYGLGDAVPPENFTSMVRAAHAYGRYKNLGAT
jgi:uroporphyrinogen decarboxylase